jgi:hypothetical protein
MDAQLKDNLVSIFHKLVNEGKFFPIFVQLNNGNYYLEVLWQNDVWNDYTDETELIPLCYLYNYKMYENRIALQEEFKSSPNYILRSQIAKDLSLISIKLGNDYMLGVFDELDKLIGDYDDSKKNNEYNMYIEGGITFLIKGLLVMKFNAQDWDKGSDYGFNEQEYLDQIHTQTEINNICEQSFFDKFNQNTKFYLKAGTQLLELVYDSNVKDLLDYSPLLVNFVKAIESETKELFQIYRDKILLYTPTIIQKIKSLDGTKSSKDLKRFADFCKLVNSHPSDYQPSGLKPLYFLFKYFFLRDESEVTGVTEDIITNLNKESLRKDKAIVSEIFRKGEIRNDFIHSRVIDSKNEFFWHYADLYSILQIIASVK